jgi:protein phosphatase
MATTFIQAELSRWIAQAGTHLKAQDLRRAIEICVDNANQAILGASGGQPQYMGMGTTLVVGVFRGTVSCWAYWRFALLPFA